MALLPYLESVLREPTRVLALGWDELAVERLRERHEVHPSELERLGSLDGDFDAVLWFDDGTLGVDSTVDLLKPRLAGGGRLIYVAPLNSAEPEVTRQRGALPSRHQLRLRQAVQALSEAGLAIARDHSLRSDEEGAGGPAGGFKVLVTRRDPLLMRAYREGDEAAIMDLFRRCFHVDRGIDHWRWKYAENPYGALRISLATTPEGQLVAHYGGYPVPVWRDGASFVALQMGDTMTDPGYRDTGRGKGALLARTVRHFFSLHRDGSFGFYFGFNTGPIQRFCRWFIGGSQTHPVTYRTRPLVDAPAFSSVRGYRIERIERVDAAWDRFFRRVAPHYGFLVQRDARYLDWRYLRCPDVAYVMLAVRRWGRLVGWGVFRRRDDRIAWGDALFKPRHARAAELLLAEAVRQPELAGAHQIATWFPQRPDWWHRQLLALGFREAPEPEGLGMVALADTEPEAFAELGAMHTTMGDGDLF